MSSLPADCPTYPIAWARPVAVADLAAGSDLRGVLHDVGHGLFTLSVLLQSARDALLPQLGGGNLFDLVDEEMSRLLAMVHSGARSSPEPTAVGLRSLLEPLAAVSRRTTVTKVSLVPGPEIFIRTDIGMLWRIVANLVDNAVRAAGPLGNVEIVPGAGQIAGRPHRNVIDDDRVMIDVIDDGPGFRSGPSGVSGLGLSVVNRLLAACDGRLEIDDVVSGGTRMRVILPRTGPGSSRAGAVATHRTDPW
jgi:signal transduction histidine kinase